MKNYVFLLLFTCFMSTNNVYGQLSEVPSSPSIINMQFNSLGGVFEFDVIGSYFSDGENIQIWIDGIPVFNSPLTAYTNMHVQVDLYNLQTSFECCRPYVECAVMDGQLLSKDGCWVDISGDRCNVSVCP